MIFKRLLAIACWLGCIFMIVASLAYYQTDQLDKATYHAVWMLFIWMQAGQIEREIKEADSQ